MKHALLSTVTGALLFTGLTGFSQTNSCATGAPSQQWEAQFQELIRNAGNDPSGRTQSVVYTVPVVIHVVHSGQPVGTYPNLAQAQLNSQIQVLNNDYAGAGLYSGNYPLQAFTNYAVTQGLPAANLDNLGRVKIANCNVQFCLATLDTSGNPMPEPGIDRINITNKGWTNPYTFTTLTTFQNYINTTIKPQSIWNPNKYLNLWITDENINAPGIGGLLGYATFPPLSGLGSSIPSANAGTSTTDGVWCYAKVFGSATYYSSGVFYSNTYNKGRTATHEIGHWLGLRHIWGDGNCQNDYCDDTPTAAASNAGTPTYPYHVGTCSNNGQDGEMFMNFMDYTNDNGKYMFSPDQAQRMLTALTNSPYRKFMGTHGLCTVPDVAATASFSMNTSACAGGSVSLNNTSGGTPVPSYSWSGTGGVVFTPNTSMTSPSVSFPAAGVYTITLTSNNGTVSTVSQTITVNPLPNLVLSTAAGTVCSGEQVTITASGANFYSWAPGGTVGSSLSFPVSQGVASFTCSATGSNGCKTKDTISITAVECMGITNYSQKNNLVSVFPNPARNLVTLHSGQALNGIVELTDLTGKILIQQPLQLGNNSSEQQVNIEALSNGVYLLRLRAGNYSQVIRLVKSN